MKLSLYHSQILRDLADRVATDPETASFHEIRDVAMIARHHLDDRIREGCAGRISYRRMCELVHDSAWASD